MALLTPVARNFILHWGEMGTRWGINRTVGQVHALLYLSAKPLSAEDIAEALSVARSNVSTSLRELQAWRVVRVVHVLGDRREYFESLQDVWEMFQIVLDGRKQREVDPTLAAVRACLAELDQVKPADPFIKARLAEMLDFLETTTGLYEEMRRFPPRTLRRLGKLRGKVRRLLGSAIN